jgi:hypothetical protein
MEEDLPSDSLELNIRSGCGVVAGILVGLFAGFVWFTLRSLPLWLFAAFVATAFAILARRYGDHFWLRLFDAIKGINLR